MIVAAAKIDNAAMDILDRELDLGSYSYSFVNLSSPLTFPPIGKDVLDDRKREIRKQAKYYNKLAAGKNSSLLGPRTSEVTLLKIHMRTMKGPNRNVRIYAATIT
ncbi:hypothetical protein Fcan01_16717 [Folsomia candida]|uniref:Uncharacterized protein n=1 Tax=Folsomia candida TaxID=158441 RepID=A0A226DTX2_FOLCA|nr:hypothetical protein Fcan01_16717 [Folsomia candida]